MRREIAVVLEADGTPRDVVITLGDGDVTAGDLLDALDLEGRLSVDGTPVHRSRRLVDAGVRRGSLLAHGPTGERLPDGSASPGNIESASLSPSFTEPWVRGPRRGRVSQPQAPIPPAPPVSPAPVVRPAMATLVVPAALAVLTAVLWNPMFAVFALIAPAVSLATWADAARRQRAGRRTGLQTHARDRLAHAVRMRTHRRVVRTVVELAHPPAHAVVEWPGRRSRRLWERRSIHDDFMQLRLGYAERGNVVAASVGHGIVIGVVGPAGARTDVIRALIVQAAAHHGPADVRMGLVAAAADWEWMKWLPHLATADSDMAFATEPGDRRLDGTNLVLCAEPPDGVAVQALLEREATVIVAADRATALPGATGLVMDVGRGVAWTPDGDREVPLRPDTLAESSAQRFARGLARLHDPERIDRGVLPGRIRLADLLDGSDAEDISTRWKRSAVAASWGAPIGVGADGTISVDLRRDGPHALVGGTTGAGKSELLRTLVVSLAASLDPGRCNFVLIDYKGGSAFDVCADLPHTVGLVTDLDEGLAERALVCLDAELRRRETALRTAGVSDLDELAHASDAPSMPRLVVVVDEFAAMAAELPDFVDRLVDVAQRGRSLGIHLVLATQRPSGVVSESIRANTDLRIALRVQSHADARDVVNDPAAADIPRTRPGRAVMRLADGTTHVQTAYTGGSGGGIDRVRCRPFRLDGASEFADEEPEGSSDLEQIVEAISRAAIASGAEPGPSPWPAPLPDEIHRSEIPSSAGRPVFGIVDEPARQRQVALEWSPTDGHLLLFGLPGSGTTTTLASIGLAVSDTDDPPHVYIVETEGVRLGPLEELANVGAVVRREEPERLLRLLRMLDDRRTVPGHAEFHPTVLLVDGFDALSETLEEIDPTGEASSILTRLMSGAARGIAVVAATHRPSGVPHRVLAACPRRLVFALADRYDYRALGCPQALRDPVPGRAIDVTTGCEVQIALPGRHGLAAAVATVAERRPTPGTDPVPVEELAALVPLGADMTPADVSGRMWRLPIGIGDRRRTTVCLDVQPGGRVLVAGPAGSGKSTALRVLGTVAHAAGLAVVVLTTPGPAAPLAGIGPVFTDAADACAALEESGHPTLVLIDDAALVDAARLVEIASADPMRIRVVAAGQTTRIRSRYGSWMSSMGSDGAGLLLGARPRDGELLDVRLPKRPGHEQVPGRGWLVAGGCAELVQVALPTI